MYNTTKSHGVDRSTGQGLYRVLGVVEAYGVELPTGCREALDTMHANTARIKSMRATGDPATAARAASAKLARGEGDIIEVLAAASAKSLSATDPYSAYSVIFANAEAIASHTAHAVLAEYGDKWVTETFRPHVTKHVTTILDAIPDLLVVDAPRDQRQMEFMLHNTAVSEAWSSLQGIYTAARQLRSYGVIPSLGERDDAYEYKGNSDVRGYLLDADITTFCWAAQNGLTPGLYTQTEINK